MNNDFLKALALEEKLNKKLVELVDEDRLNFVSLSDKLFAGDSKCLKAKSDLERLAVVIEALDKTYNRYKELNIPDEIFFDTISDIRIWCENNDNEGLKNSDWLSNHICCKLFKIGRLQYQLYPCTNKTLDYSRLPFDFGDKLIYIHIPQGERLNYSDCINSIREAIEFFEKYFPDYEFDYFFCESWLLYEDNWLFMENTSNILQFSTLFDIAYSVDEPHQAIERIFGKRRLRAADYPEDTSLQRSAKRHLKNKGRLGLGIGYINKLDLKA